MRPRPMHGFLLLTLASILWIIAALSRGHVDYALVSAFRAFGFLLAAVALRSPVERHARLLGGGLLLAGTADLAGFVPLLSRLSSIDVAAEAIELLGSVWIIVLGIRWVATQDLAALRSLRWPITLIGATAVYWTIVTLMEASWWFFAGNLLAVLAAVIVVRTVQAATSGARSASPSTAVGS